MTETNFNSKGLDRQLCKHKKLLVNTELYNINNYYHTASLHNLASRQKETMKIIGDQTKSQLGQINLV